MENKEIDIIVEYNFFSLAVFLMKGKTGHTHEWETLLGKQFTLEFALNRFYCNKANWALYMREHFSNNMIKLLLGKYPSIIDIDDLEVKMISILDEYSDIVGS